jgi:hypothetical protein
MKNMQELTLLMLMSTSLMIAVKISSLFTAWDTTHARFPARLVTVVIRLATVVLSSKR